MDSGPENRVTIQMSPATVTALQNSGYSLYGLLAVQSSDSAGRPLVLIKTRAYLVSTQVSWTDRYQAYLSFGEIEVGERITANYSVPIELGNTLQAQQGGIGQVVEGGREGGISILNTTAGQYTCGIAVMENNVVSPVCAFPLYGGGLQTIVPSKKFLLLFSTASTQPGTAIDYFYHASGPGAYSPAILIDLAENDSPSVVYDINRGWSWGGYGWAKTISAASDLSLHLIDR